jgi:DNA-binding NarL/FixJ family response regulator
MIRLFIVEDHQVVIEGLQSLLQGDPDIQIVGSAVTAAGCLEGLAHQKADVVLADINLPDRDGVELCKAIKQIYKDVMVLMLSTFNQGIYMNKAMENGASGYLLKNATRRELIDGIKTASRGGVYFSFEAGKIYKAAVEAKSRQPVLSKREVEIMKLIAEGLTNPQIGKQLFISTDTVDTHRKNLYTKLGINNTALLIRYAIDNGIVSLRL